MKVAEGRCQLRRGNLEEAIGAFAASCGGSGGDSLCVFPQGAIELLQHCPYDHHERTQRRADVSHFEHQRRSGRNRVLLGVPWVIDHRAVEVAVKIVPAPAFRVSEWALFDGVLEECQRLVFPLWIA